MQSSDEIEVRPARASELIDLRHEILRAGLPRSEAFFPGDDDLATRHFIAVRDRKTIGCVTLLLNEWEGEVAWQLRGMAVAAGVQRSGIGAKLLAAVDESVKRSAAMLLWCNARTPAIGFYERDGWSVASAEFMVSTAGPHVKMTKRLKPDVAGVR